MNTFNIKLIAIATMIVDHVGLFFFPQIFLLRVIGRLSFPLFAWLIANGAIHTKNINAYAIRLFLLAIISQIPFSFANQLKNIPFEGLNIVFTLFLGLAAIMIVKKTSKKYLWFSIAIGASFIANILNVNYGAAGVLSIIAFYLFYKKLDKMIFSQILILLVFPYLILFFEILCHLDLSFYYMNSYYEFFGIFSLLFIAKYNGKEGYKAKYLFYSFYPLHYVAILFLKLLLSK